MLDIYKLTVVNIWLDRSGNNQIVLYTLVEHINMEDLFCNENLETSLENSSIIMSITNSMVDPVLLKDSRVLENMLNDEISVTKTDYCSNENCSK